MDIGYLMQGGAPDLRSQPFSGPANHVRQVIKELNKLGHKVRLLVQYDERVWKSDDLESFNPVPSRYLDSRPFRLTERFVRRLQHELRLPYAALFQSLRFALACNQELRGFDLLYERMGWSSYGGALAAGRLDLPLVLEVNGDHLSEMEKLNVAPQGFQRWLSIRLTGWGVRRAAHIVAAGEGWRTCFIDQWQVDPRKVTVVENGSELVDILEREQLRTFRTRVGAPQVTKIVFVGGFQQWQGVSVLLHALARVTAQSIPVQLTLIGAGPEAQTVKQLVRQLEMDACVRFTGFLPPDQLAVSLAEADIGVSPYCGRAEYSGLKLLDYKAAGLAIIASGQNGQPSILVHGKTGWIVPPCDEKALADAISLLSTDSELRRRIGREARNEAEVLHRWRKTAEQLDALFNHLKKPGVTE